MPWRRARKLASRMALGARASNLLRLVISRGLRVTSAGILFGIGAALALTRMLGQLLYNVSPAIREYSDRPSQ